MDLNKQVIQVAEIPSPPLARHQSLANPAVDFGCVLGGVTVPCYPTTLHSTIDTIFTARTDTGTMLWGFYIESIGKQQLMRCVRQWFLTWQSPILGPDTRCLTLRPYKRCPALETSENLYAELEQIKECPAQVPGGGG